MIYKALGSKTRVEMLKLLMKGEYHVSGLAKALGISLPVAAKHVRILENAELVGSKKFGKMHVLSVNKERLDGEIAIKRVVPVLKKRVTVKVRDSV